MYQKNWDEYLELLQKKKLSDEERLSRLGEELDGVEQWKHSKNTMTRIYPTSSNIKELENYFNSEFILKLEQRLGDKFKLDPPQSECITSFIHKFRQITLNFLYDNNKKHSDMLRSLYSSDFAAGDSSKYLKMTFESIVKRILCLQGIPGDFVSDLLQFQALGGWKFHLEFFSWMLKQYCSYNEFTQKLEDIFDDLVSSTSFFNGFIIPVMLSALSPGNSTVFENWVRSDKNGIIVMGVEPKQFEPADKINTVIKAVELICAETLQNSERDKKILIICQNLIELKVWKRSVVERMGLPAFHITQPKIKLSSYDRVKKISIEFMSIRKISRFIYGYPFDTNQILKSFMCDLMVLDNISLIKKNNLKVLEIPFKHLIGFTDTFDDFKRAVSIAGKFTKIVYPTETNTSEIQDPGIPEIQSNQQPRLSEKRKRKRVIKTLDFFL